MGLRSKIGSKVRGTQRYFRKKSRTATKRDIKAIELETKRLEALAKLEKKRSEIRRIQNKNICKPRKTKPKSKPKPKKTKPKKKPRKTSKRISIRKINEKNKNWSVTVPGKGTRKFRYKIDAEAYKRSQKK